MRKQPKSVLASLLLALLFFLTSESARAAVTLTLNKSHTNGADSIALGVPITYVITLSNSGDLNDHITVMDTVPAGFVFLDATCTAALGAVCPAAPLQPPTFGDLSIPTNGTITLHMTGYFKTVGSKVNVARAVARDGQGNLLPVGNANESTVVVTVPTGQLPIDLAIDKCVGPAAACVQASSATFPAVLHYRVTVSNKTANQSVYLGGLLTVVDDLMNNFSVPVSYSLLSFTCTPAGGAVCPDLPLASSGTLNKQILFTYNANNHGFLPGNASYTLEFDVNADTKAACKNGSVTLRNRAFLSLSNGVDSLSDAVASNNFSQQTTTTITGGLPPDCPPGLQSTKLQTNPTGNVGVWNQPVTYRVKVTNPAGGTAVTNLALTDRIYKVSGTPPFTATVTAPGPICLSGCSTLTDVVLLNPNVNADLPFRFNLWTAVVPGLAPGQTAEIEYTVTYAPVCETDMRSDRITNEFFGSGFYSFTQTNLDEAGRCNLAVAKSAVTAGPIVFEQPFEYEVAFSNPSSATLLVGSVRDVMSIASARYGSFKMDYKVSCTATAGTVTPVPADKNVTGATVSHHPVGWRGIRLIDESLTFGPGSTLTCKVVVTAHQPTDANPFCQGAGSPQLVNSAYMDLTRFYNENDSHEPEFYSSVEADLPLCRSVIVTKKANTHNFGPGATVVYTLQVENHGDDPVDSLTLTDLVQAPLAAVAVSPCTPAACTSGPALAGNQVDVAYGTLQKKVPVSFNLTVLAPQAGGSYPNLAQGAFPPGGNFYFKGDQATFLQQEENIQVVTPTLRKAYDLATIGPNGTATLVFTLTNTNGDPQQNGIAFADTLSPGLLAGSVASNSCGGTVSLSPDKRTIALAGGQLSSGTHTCQIAVLVEATGLCGTHTNAAANFAGVANLDVSAVAEQLEIAGCALSDDIDVSLSTGLDEATGALLPRGAADDDWTARLGNQPPQPALLVVQPPPAWHRFRPSEWISDTAAGAAPAGGTVRYERCFCIAPDATNAKLTLRLWADDLATVRLNGTVIAGPGGQFRRRKPLAVLYMGAVGGSLFQTGDNCVSVDVADLRPGAAGLDISGSVWIDHGHCAGASY